MLNPKKTYHRKKGILYDESGTQILKFAEATNDSNNLTGDLVKNMNNYIRCYPNRVEIIENKKDVQLNLFQMKTKSKTVPYSKIIDNTSYLKINDNTEAKKVVAESRDLPHLQKPIKYILK